MPVLCRLWCDAALLTSFQASHRWRLGKLLVGPSQWGYTRPQRFKSQYALQDGVQALHPCYDISPSAPLASWVRSNCWMVFSSQVQKVLYWQAVLVTTRRSCSSLSRRAAACSSSCCNMSTCRAQDVAKRDTVRTASTCGIGDLIQATLAHMVHVKQLHCLFELSHGADSRHTCRVCAVHAPAAPSMAPHLLPAQAPTLPAVHSNSCNSRRQLQTRCPTVLLTAAAASDQPCSPASPHMPTCTHIHYSTRANPCKAWMHAPAKPVHDCAPAASTAPRSSPSMLPQPQPPLNSCATHQAPK